MQSAAEDDFCTTWNERVSEMSSGDGSEAGDPRARSRPLGVWAIAAFYLLSAGWTLLSFVMVLSGAVPLTPADEAYVTSLGVLDYLGSLGVGAITCAGAVLFFALRKAAVMLFSIGLALNVAVSLVHAATTDFLAVMSGPGLLGMLIGWALMAGVVLYARSLQRQGILA